MYELQREIVSDLNNFMEQDSEYWTKEFGCKKEEIVRQYGFGYCQDGTIKYMPELNEVKVDLEKLHRTIKLHLNHTQEMRNLINWLFTKGE